MSSTDIIRFSRVCKQSVAEFKGAPLDLSAHRLMLEGLTSSFFRDVAWCITGLKLCARPDNIGMICHLSECKSLRSIDIEWCEQLPHDVQTSIEMGGLTKLTKLHTLGLRNSTRANFSELILPLRQSLQTLDLNKCCNLADVSILGTCHVLSRLSLRGCSRLSNVNGLGRSTSLQELNLSRCTQLAELSGLGGCVSLLKLIAHGCENLVDVSGLIGCCNLRFLDVSFCCRLPNLSGIEYCKRLETIDISHSTMLLDMKHLSRCANLQTIRIDDESGPVCMVKTT